jgi:hypothetical protein
MAVKQVGVVGILGPIAAADEGRVAVNPAMLRDGFVIGIKVVKGIMSLNLFPGIEDDGLELRGEVRLVTVFEAVGPFL